MKRFLILALALAASFANAQIPPGPGNDTKLIVFNGTRWQPLLLGAVAWTASDIYAGPGDIAKTLIWNGSQWVPWDGSSGGVADTANFAWLADSSNMAFSLYGNAYCDSVIATATLGDSVIISSTADYAKSIFSVNGTQGSVGLNGTTLTLASPGHISAFPVNSGSDFATGRINAYSIDLSPTLGPGNSGVNNKVRSSASYIGIYGTAATGYGTSLGYTDSTKGVFIDSLGWRLKESPSGLFAKHDTLGWWGTYRMYAPNNASLVLNATTDRAIDIRTSGTAGRITVNTGIDSLNLSSSVLTAGFLNLHSSGSKVRADTFNVGGSLLYVSTVPGFHNNVFGATGLKILGTNGVYTAGYDIPIYTSGNDHYVRVYGSKNRAYAFSAGYTDSTKGVVADSTNLRVKGYYPSISVGKCGEDYCSRISFTNNADRYLQVGVGGSLLSTGSFGTLANQGHVVFGADDTLKIGNNGYARPTSFYSNNINVANIGSDGFSTATGNISTTLADGKASAPVHGFVVYAAGARPAAPSIGDMIVISADKDSTLQYMGGAWQTLYVEP